MTITKSITISCEGVTAGVLAAGTNGIIINVPASSIVYLRGLDIQGITTGLAGVHFIQAGILHVEHCLIRGFNAGTAAGINFAPTGASELYVSEFYITDNGTGATGAGILIRPTGTGSANVVLNQIMSRTMPRGSRSTLPAAPVLSTSTSSTAYRPGTPISTSEPSPLRVRETPM